MDDMMAGSDRCNARNVARYFTKQYNNGQANEGYGETSRKQAGYKNSKTSKDKSSNNITSVYYSERQKSYLKDEARAREEQMEFSVCYDETQYNMADPCTSSAPEHITFRNNGDKVAEVESKVHTLMGQLDIDQYRSLHAWLYYQLQPNETVVDEEEEEGKHESDNEEINEVGLKPPVRTKKD